ncbi:unnamed protein product [Echinostoma caproni]|uniref:G_PROTEIN_RECEP_F1_2 domain-containing protein n=1 Tax=Echinostoma caproni TaxID=27848 RepID=A0A183A850_9TREM|nr:unnamed protein product [Echinostoma caproni]
MFSIVHALNQLFKDGILHTNFSSTDSLPVPADAPNLSSHVPILDCASKSCSLSDGVNLTNSTYIRPTTSMTAWTTVQLSILPILLLLIACIGLVGNALNLLVLYSYHTTQIACGGECTARVNLLGLALADFLVCLASLPLGYVQRRHDSYSFMLFYTLIGPGLVTYFLAVSVWMVLLMSVVRYMAVCRPLTSRTWLTPRHMFRVILGIYVVALVFHIPSFLMFTYEEESALQKSSVTKCRSSNQTVDRSVGTNRTMECDTSLAIFVFERSFWRSEAIYIGYHVVNIVLTNIGPFIGVLISNIAVIRACRRSDACRRSFVGSSLTNRDIGLSGVFLFNPPSVAPLRVSIQRYPNSATNRVTPLLLAVIIAFLLFTAPFGIVHFVCLQLMRKLGVRVRNNQAARQLYTALNLTVEWTNVVQLLGCALNFFLYFLVSTIFRRTTKRTFRRLYKQVRTCRSKVLISLFLGKHSKSMDSWERDTRTNELRRELEYKVAPAPYTPMNKRSRCYSSNTSRGMRSFRSSSSTNGKLANCLRRGHKRSFQSTRLLTAFPGENKLPTSALADSQFSRTAHSLYDPCVHHRTAVLPYNNKTSSYTINQPPPFTQCARCDHEKRFHRSLPGCNSCCLMPMATCSSYNGARSDPQCCATHSASSFLLKQVYPLTPPAPPPATTTTTVQPQPQQDEQDQPPQTSDMTPTCGSDENPLEGEQNLLELSAEKV